MNETLNVGDVVRLNSGGPSMSVVCVTDLKAYCAWHDAENRVQRELFPLACLTRLSAPAPTEVEVLLVEGEHA